MNDLNELIEAIITTIEDYVIYLIIALAILYFVVSIFKYIKAVDEKTRNDSVKAITLGIVIIFVMVSVWGLVRIIGSVFDINVDSDLPSSFPNNDQDVDSLIKTKIKQ